MLLTRFEQENGHLVQVEVDEVFGFPCHITTEVPPHDAVPGGVVLLVELLDTGCSVLLYMIFLQCLSSTLHRVLLRLLWHTGILDLSLSVTHGYQGAGAGRLQQSPGRGAGEAHTCVERGSQPKPWRILLSRKTFLMSPVSLLIIIVSLPSENGVKVSESRVYLTEPCIREQQSKSRGVMPSHVAG